MSHDPSGKHHTHAGNLGKSTMREADKEIARLRDKNAKLAAQVIEAEKYNGLHQLACIENAKLRAATIEQCAKVADSISTTRGNADYRDGWEWAQVNIAAAIRALAAAQQEPANPSVP